MSLHAVVFGGVAMCVLKFNSNLSDFIRVQFPHKMHGTPLVPISYEKHGSLSDLGTTISV